MTRHQRIVRDLRQQIMQRICNMPPVQPKILIYRIRTALVLVRHPWQTHPVLRIIRTIAIQNLVVSGLGKSGFIIQSVVEEGVHVDVPNYDVVVFVGELSRHAFQACVVVVHLDLFGLAHETEFGSAVERWDRVDNNVAGAALVELFEAVSHLTFVC